MAAGIGHDLMGVLASHSTSLEFLAPTLAAADAWLAASLSDGVRQIHCLASARAGERLVDDPLHLVKDARQLMAQAIPGIAVGADSLPGEGLVWGAPILLRQLLIGLCAEACTHLPQVSTLTLRASRVVSDGLEGGGAPRAPFEIEGDSEDGARGPNSVAGTWREGPATAGLLSAFSAPRGEVGRRGFTVPGFGAPIEMPIATPPGEDE